MIPEGRKRVLRVFHDAPDKEFHVRGIARRAKIAVDNAHRYLHEFVKSEFLTKRKDGKMTLFKANLKNPLLRKFFEYLELERTCAFVNKNPHFSEIKKITDKILENTEGVQMVFLFASTSDMFVVVSNNVKRPFENSKVIKSVTLKEFEDLLADKKFFEKFFEERITLHNESLFWNEVGKLVK